MANSFYTSVNQPGHSLSAHRSATTASILLLLLLSACSWSPVKNGGSYSPSVADDANAANIPDAVPRVEARSRRGNPAEYTVFGKKYRVWSDRRAAGYKERGKASWYGPKFHGRPTSSGEPFDMMKMTAAHKHLPIPCYVRVTHRDNGRSIIVRVNDRGPFVGSRIIDLSYAAASKLGMRKQGVADVSISLIDPTNYQPVSYQPAPEYNSGGYQASESEYSEPLDNIPTAKTWPTTAAETSEIAPNVISINAGNSRTSTAPSANSNVRGDGNIGDIRALANSTGIDSGQYDGGYDSVYIDSPSSTAESDRDSSVSYQYEQAAEQQAFEEQTSMPRSTRTQSQIMGRGVEEIAFKQQPTAPPLPAPPATNSSFYVQIATFRNNSNALRMAQRLVDAKFEPVRLVPGRMGNDPVQQIRVGPLATVADAERFQQRLSQAGYQRTLIIREVASP